MRRTIRAAVVAAICFAFALFFVTGWSGVLQVSAAGSSGKSAALQREAKRDTPEHANGADNGKVGEDPQPDHGADDPESNPNAHHGNDNANQDVLGTDDDGDSEDGEDEENNELEAAGVPDSIPDEHANDRAKVEIDGHLVSGLGPH
jgi:hypothetical protein